MVYDGRAVTIYVDGEEAASAAVEGITKPLEHWGLVIGNYWNASVKGIVRDLTLSAEIEGLGADGPPLVLGEQGSAGDDDGAPQAPAAGDDDGDSGSGSGSDSGSGSGAQDGGKPSDPGSASGGGATLVRLDFDEDVSDRSGNGAHIQWDPGAVRFVEGADGSGRAVALGAGDGAVTISRYNADLFGRDSFAIAFDLKREGTDGDGGRVLSLHKALDLTLTDDGGLRFALTTDEGTAVARSDASVIGTGWQRVELGYDSDQGAMTIAVDGEEVARAAQQGTTPEASHWGLTLGRPWGGEARGFVDEFVFRGEADGGAGGETGAPAPSSPEPEPGPAPSGGATLVALDFEGDLSDADGRSVGVRADGPIGYAKGSEGRGVTIGEGSVLIARENAFLHERDSFEFAFDLKRDGASEDGRVLQLNRAVEAWVAKDGTMDLTLRTDEGTFRLETDEGAVSARGWHQVEIGYDDAAGRLRLTVDGESVETQASGTTPEGSYWGLMLGSAWGDTLGATIDGFRMSDAPDWA